jgi:hypothetical protein
MKPAQLHVQTQNSKRALTAGHGVALHSNLWRLGAMALLCLTALGSASLQAQMVTVNPVETPGSLSNPLMGFRSKIDFFWCAESL